MPLTASVHLDRSWKTKLCVRGAIAFRKRLSDPARAAPAPTSTTIDSSRSHRAKTFRDSMVALLRATNCTFYSSAFRYGCMRLLWLLWVYTYCSPTVQYSTVRAVLYRVCGHEPETTPEAANLETWAFSFVDVGFAETLRNCSNSSSTALAADRMENARSPQRSLPLRLLSAPQPAGPPSPPRHSPRAYVGPGMAGPPCCFGAQVAAMNPIR